MKRFALVGTILCGLAQPASAISPYILGSEAAGTDLRAKAVAVKESLRKAGFSVVGMYKPYRTAWVITITNGTLKTMAARSHRGAFGAVLRVGVTQVGDKIQVSYSNPTYWKHAFRMIGNVNGIATKLQGALGKVKAFPAKGLSMGELRKYHYKIFMPYFSDQDKLASHGSHSAAIAAVEGGLKNHYGGSKKIYRVKIPGKQQVVYGVQLYKGCAAESHIMKKIDKSALRSTPHLPYQLMVDGKEVWALRGRFRIAVAFPNLSMGTFIRIRCAPGAIQDALELVAKNKRE
jgi:hypothetical protein